MIGLYMALRRYYHYYDYETKDLFAKYILCDFIMLATQILNMLIVVGIFPSTGTFAAYQLRRKSSMITVMASLGHSV